MNARRTIALLFVGWYLIAPPALDPRTQNTSLFVDSSAPLRKWDILATFPSKVECELARRDRLRRLVKAAEEDEREAAMLAREGADLVQQKPLDSEKADALCFRVLIELFKEQAVQREVSSKCIANSRQSTFRR